MFAGHIGGAFAVARLERRVNVGALVAASLLLDFLLWLFILLGWESVAIPADFPRTHQPEFVFPYSHGLLATVVWSGLAGALTFWLLPGRTSQKARSALLVAGVVFSHWPLDALVHRPELPVAGATSTLLGIGLWNNMPVALVIEGAVVALGMYLFLPGCGISRGKKRALAALSLLVLAFTVVGMTVAPPPPSVTAMAASSLGTIVVVSVLIGWLGSGVRERQAQPLVQADAPRHAAPPNSNVMRPLDLHQRDDRSQTGRR